eukprot:488636_1
MGVESSTPSYSEQTKNDIDNAIKEPLVLFSASYCGYCSRVKGILKPWEPYKIIEVDQINGGTMMAQYKSYLSQITGSSRITWPRVFIGGKCVGGCDDITRLQQTGILGDLITAAKKSKDYSKL